MKTQSILFPLLPGLNEIIAHAKRRGPQGWSGYAELKRGWQERLVYEIKSQKIHKVKAYPIELTFEWGEKNKRRDPDNLSSGGRKWVLDALVAARVLTGDGWREIRGWQDVFFVRAAHPGVRVWIYEPDD